jgi:hypothetical protein
MNAISHSEFLKNHASYLSFWKKLPCQYFMANLLEHDMWCQRSSAKVLIQGKLVQNTMAKFGKQKPYMTSEVWINLIFEWMA